MNKKEFLKIWRQENDRGYGFDPHGGRDINRLKGTGTLLDPARNTSDVAVYDYGDTYIIVGDSNGPWAVQVAKHEVRTASVKDQLIKLGSTNPELRPHIRAILTSSSLSSEEKEVMDAIRDTRGYGLLRSMMDKDEIRVADALVKKGLVRKGTSDDRQKSRVYFIAD